MNPRNVILYKNQKLRKKISSIIIEKYSFAARYFLLFFIIMAYIYPLSYLFIIFVFVGNL